MDHNDIRHKLSEYIDGAVTPQERTAIDEHLKTCAACSTALAELRKTIEAVKQIEEVEAPAWMTQKIMANVRAAAGENKGFFRRLFYPLAVKLPLQAVGVLFLTVTVYYLYSSTHPADTQVDAPVGRLAKQDTPAVPRDAAKGKAPEIPAEREKKAEQGPGYKSLDMKYSYEKPASPVPAAPGAEFMAKREEPVASAPAKRAAAGPEKDEASREARPAAPQAAAPSLMAEQASPAAGASGRSDAPERSAQELRKAKSSFPADKESDTIRTITEHFVKHDLPVPMRKEGLHYRTRKFEAGRADLLWMQETNAFRSNPCGSRYVVDVDLSGSLSKYLYCYDQSLVRLLGIYELRQDVWSEKRP